MNDDSAAELLIPARVTEKWVAWINQTSREGTPVKLIPDLYIGGDLPHLTVKMADYQGKMLAIQRWDLLDYHPLEAAGVLVPVSENDVAHSNGGMP